MTTLMPKDADKNPIPLLMPRPGGGHIISATSSPKINTIAFAEETKAVSMHATVPIYFRLGNQDVEVSAGDNPFPSGLIWPFSLGGGKKASYRHISVIRKDDTDGEVWINELT